MIKYIYTRKATLFYISQFLVIPLLALTVIWIIYPDCKLAGPIITLIGFVAALFSALPTIIKNAFPHIKYEFELSYSFIKRLKDIIQIEVNANEYFNEENRGLKLRLALTSDEVAYVKDILIYFNERLINGEDITIKNNECYYNEHNIIKSMRLESYYLNEDKKIMACFKPKLFHPTELLEIMIPNNHYTMLNNIENRGIKSLALILGDGTTIHIKGKIVDKLNGELARYNNVFAK
jgi:hypothetical protein